jgi:transposase
MGQPHPLTEVERQRIYEGRVQGKTISDIAQALDRSPAVIRKWWRRVRDEGVVGLRTRPRGPKPRGTLSRFDPRVSETALQLKRGHQRWGADRVRAELHRDIRLDSLPLPSRSRLAAFFKDRCPECVAAYKPRPPTPPAPPPATAVHEVWQLDNQENVELADGEIAVICSIRDPFGAAMVASRAFAARTAKHWRKLDWTEIRQTLRDGFIEWQTLPDEVRTDNELNIAGSPRDPFPSKLTLWLRGLGVKHSFIRPHCPTDQPHIERNHRTLDGFTSDTDSRANLASLQQALTQERHIYNEAFPCRASDCAGQPPLTAHPELRQPRRSYQAEHEWILFDIQRVYDFLAGFTFERRVNGVGIVSLGRHPYSAGRCHAGKALWICCDPITREWVFLEKVEEEGKVVERELLRRPVKHLDAQSLTGLEPPSTPVSQAIQLTLPCLAP